MNALEFIVMSAVGNGDARGAGRHPNLMAHHHTWSLHEIRGMAYRDLQYAARTQAQIIKGERALQDFEIELAPDYVEIQAKAALLLIQMEEIRREEADDAARNAQQGALQMERAPA